MCLFHHADNVMETLLCSGAARACLSTVTDLHFKVCMRVCAIVWCVCA